MPIIEGATGQPILYAGTPSNGTDEVQLLTYTATTGSNVADSGTFTITFDGYTTTPLAFNAADAVVEAALVALPSIGAAGCTVSVAAGPPRVYTVTFGGGNMLKRALALMTTTSSLLQGAHPVTVVVTESVAGVNATALGAAIGAQLIDTATGKLYVNSGTALAPVWTGYTTTSASTAELNLIDNSVAGTAVASKAAVLGASKNLDILGLPVGGLKIGAAGAEVAVTPTAAEINILAGVTPGTAIASKAVVTDANIDVTGLRNVTATGIVQALTLTATGTVGGVSVTASGALTGATVVAKNPVVAVSASGAITVPAGNTTYFITKAGVAAMTLVNPTTTTHDGLRLTFLSTTAEAHTLSNAAGSGFNGLGAGADIGTFGGAIGDRIIIEAYQGKWYVVDNVNVTLA